MTLLIALVNSTIPNPIHSYATSHPPVTIRANGWQALGTITSPAGSTVSFYEGAQAGAGTPVFSEDLPDGTVIDLRDAQTIDMGTFTTQAAASGGGGTGGGGTGGGTSSSLAIGTPVTGGTNGDALAIDSAGKLAAVPFPTGGGGTTLPNLSPSPAGTYGDATHSAQFTVNAQGLITSAVSVPIAFPAPAINGNAFPKPTSAAELASLWNAAIAGGYILLLDPTTSITDSASILINGIDAGQQPRGLMGNGASFTYTGDGPAVTIKSGPVNGNRGMVLTQFHIVGDYTKTTSTGLYINADAGASIYKFTCRDLYVDGFGTGARIEANFFESLLDNWQIENNKGDGVQIADGPGQAIDGIISNVIMQNPNISRNGGIGIHMTTAKSVDVQGGSFIEDAGGGIVAENGARKVDGPNFENCGQVGITLDAPADAGCTVVNCSGSNTGGGIAGGPMTSLIKYTGPAGGLTQSGNQMYNGTILAP